MTSPSAPDLSKLRINRDAAPAPLRRAWGRNVAIGLVALVIVAVVLLMGRGRGHPEAKRDLANGSAFESEIWGSARDRAGLGWIWEPK